MEAEMMKKQEKQKPVYLTLGFRHVPSVYYKNFSVIKNWRKER